MALFGAPLPLDDCTGSAVAAALEMVELIEQFAPCPHVISRVNDR
jgi:hypothetical protein